MTSSVSLGTARIGGRIKEARARLGLTQKALCDAVGMPLPSLRDYELGKTIPGGEAIEALIRGGINANWLLTGVGPMLLKDPELIAGAFNYDRLRNAVLTVENGLQDAGKSMAADKKADLVAFVYNLLGEPSVAQDRLLHLVKDAA